MSIQLRRGLAVCLLLLGLLGVTAWCSRTAAWQPGQPALRNPIDQREQMIKELQEIKALLREQNALLINLAKK